MYLGIDTAAGQCAVALVSADDTVRARRDARMERGHADHLFPMIDAVLAAAVAGADRLERIGVCTGPGSFTGIRVGVAAARGLGLGLGVAVIGIDRFSALYWSWRASNPPSATEMRVAIAIAGPQETAYLRILDGICASIEPRFEADRQVPRGELDALVGPKAVRLGDGWPGAAVAAGLPDPAQIARHARGTPADPFTAPRAYYLRGPNADPPRAAPPPLLDP
ncbi:MAG: tRNA (adenosine(37)-N6)-threonylcarbamoyltransferase complex dimerization subunit type 1 TsaB [Paracoccaceae bacterium]